MQNKIRILIVEDSSLMRKIISDIISSESQFEVIAKAGDGKQALEKVFRLCPDVITLDVNLPSLSGLDVLKEIMQKQPTRVIMLSAYTQQGAAATIRALELGAVDFISKPSGEVSVDLNSLKDEIISKIKMAVKVDWQRFLSNLGTLQALDTLELGIEVEKVSEIKKLVVIGASTGGPRAILKIMRDIPSDIPAAFLIVQHMPEGFTLSFAERLSWESRIKSKEAEDGDVILPGRAYIAPGGCHMTLEKFWDKERNRLKIKLDQQSSLVNFVRPSISVTMTSATKVFSPNVVGVILSGMGKDGLEGAGRIKERGGLVIAQDEATSVVWGMPGAVTDKGLVDYVLPLSKISAAIIKSIGR